MLIPTKKTAVASFALLVMSSLFFASSASAIEKTKANTVVTVGEMCGGCVKRITKRFSSEKKVAKVICSIKEKTVTIVPATGVKLSPKTIWEIMDGIGKTPKKLSGPDGTFTSKPKS